MYYGEGNLNNMRIISKLMEKYGILLPRCAGVSDVQNFQCLPLYGPRNTEDLKDAMGTFEIPFRAEDYRE